MSPDYAADNTGQTTLLEQIARRLGEVYRRSAGWASPEVHWGDRDDPDERLQNAQRLNWLAVADECIRQMRFTALVTIAECEEAVGAAGGTIHLNVPALIAKVALMDPENPAPEGWKQ